MFIIKSILRWNKIDVFFYIIFSCETLFLTYMWYVATHERKSQLIWFTKTEGHLPSRNSYFLRCHNNRIWLKKMMSWWNRTESGSSSTNREIETPALCSPVWNTVYFIVIQVSHTSLNHSKICRIPHENASFMWYIYFYIIHEAMFFKSSYILIWNERVHRVTSVMNCFNRNEPLLTGSSRSYMISTH